MKPVQLLQICLITSSSSTLFNDRRLNNIISALYSRRSLHSGRQRHRRATSAPSTPSSQRRRIGAPSYCRSTQKAGRPFAWTNMTLEHRRSRASQDVHVSLDAVLGVSNNDVKAWEAPLATGLEPSPMSDNMARDEQGSKDMSFDNMPPPSETLGTRSIRSTSTSSRNANRLSLTLPIAPPDSVSSRPPPSGTASMPPTPGGETPTLSSPTDPNEIIIAIAAQERRVLELREELSRAEGDLRKLQKQWAVSEGYRKRRNNKNAERAPTLIDLDDGYHDSPAAKRNAELERRKAILLAQSQATPQRHKRTVIRGGHTRALSLLSPTKPSSEVSSLDYQDGLRSPESYTSRSSMSSAPPTAALSKRATWAPRQNQQPSGVKQIANDFRQGLWTFVEDLRQATVGDEAVSGTTHRTSEMASRPGRTDGDHDTIRASTANRGRIPFPAEFDAASDSPSRSSTGSFSDRFHHGRSLSKAESKTRKHYSWTPLTFDNFDDDDWSNWDSPNIKTARWSGSTVNGDIIPAIPEKLDENEGTLRRKRSRNELRSPSPSTSSKLEELPQAILNRLTPSNIKNTTSNFIKEWEKSLSPPPETANFDSALQDMRHSIL
ncbi:hypothetical protein F5Y15DRAFT_332893 [Xylariaceae sp. FL0016]|nr:hypothetical protein F5Y15DRAFT_332893 [Xylariaceae sp. FL0016]